MFQMKFLAGKLKYLTPPLLGGGWEGNVLRDGNLFRQFENKVVRIFRVMDIY